jgi:hypothetical protein
VKIAYLDE